MKLDTYKAFHDLQQAGPINSVSTIEARVLLPTLGWLEGGVSINDQGFLAIVPGGSSGLTDGGEIFVDLSDVIAIQSI